MTSSQAEITPIRLWPAWAILALQAVAMILTITPSINNATRFFIMMLGPLVCVLAFFVWLGLASRLPKKERLLTILAILGLGVAAGFLVDPSVRVAVWIYGVPLAMFAVTTALWLTRQTTRRLTAVVAGLVVAFGVTGLIRLGGFTGTYLPEVSWRWAALPEDGLAVEGARREGGDWQAVTADWPGYRGPKRDGRVTGIAALDWSVAPTEVWRIPMGPAWSSFSHASGRLFTHEQRGEQEVISCYDAATGEVIWQHGYAARFNEVVSGAGPRATPTFADGRIFALGGTGKLTALDAASGRLLWQRDLVAEVDAPLPVWGFSSSPLVIGGAAIVYAGGEGDNGLVAYRTADGEPAWQIEEKGMNYSSAQQVRLGERDLVLFAATSGLLALDPVDGTVAWRFVPSNWKGAPMVQVQQIGPHDVVVPVGDGGGVARIEAKLVDGTWQVSERWFSRGLKPSYNDFVYHDGYLYGFDQSIFACVDAETGKRQWKGGRYGFGQAVLLEDSSQLVIAAENGDVVLLAADPAGHEELARWPVLDGKTWNHPMVADGHLIVRNGKEAVSLDLS